MSGFNIPKFCLNSQFAAYPAMNDGSAKQRRYGGEVPYGFPQAGLSDDQFQSSSGRSKVKTGLYITGGILGALVAGGFALRYFSPKTYENIAKAVSENAGKYMPAKATEWLNQCKSYGRELIGKIKSSHIGETVTHWFKNLGKKSV